MGETWRRREHGKRIRCGSHRRFAPPLLADATDLIPLRSGGGTQFSRQFSRFAVQAGKGFRPGDLFPRASCSQASHLTEDRKSKLPTTRRWHVYVPDAVSSRSGGDHGDRDDDQVLRSTPGPLKIFPEWGIFRGDLDFGCKNIFYNSMA